MKNIKIPIGRVDFQDIIKNSFYYIDKTKFIYDFLTNQDIVTFITRPRRFGKTLLLSTLQEFFSLYGDSSVFKNLEIMQYPEVCEQWMNKRPVIFLSLKDAWNKDFNTAKESFLRNISYALSTLYYKMEEQEFNGKEKIKKEDLIEIEHIIKRHRDTSEATLVSSISILTKIIKSFYGLKTILLIDEYDVPLAKAYQYGYYDKMVLFFSKFMNYTLKDNSNIEFAILTGCLPILKESIYTEINNFSSYNIYDSQYEACCGFTPEEVSQLLLSTGLSDYSDKIKEWYDGYIFGESQKIYNPWDILNYIRRVSVNKKLSPENYWENTSENDIIWQILNNSGLPEREKIEKLLDGNPVKVTLLKCITYRNFYKNDTLWNILYLTGYLTKTSQDKLIQYNEIKNNEEIYLSIPNREIMELFEEEVNRWNRNSLDNNIVKDIYSYV